MAAWEENKECNGRLGTGGTLVPSYGKWVGMEADVASEGCRPPCPSQADGFGERLGPHVVSPFAFSPLLVGLPS